MNSATLTVPLLETAGLSPRQSELLARGRKAAQGMLPNMYRAMAYSPALLATYLYGYEALRKEAGFTPAELEVIFLVISDENACDYCVAAHSLVADTLSRVPRTVTDAIRSGQDIPDSKLSVLAEVTRRVLLSRGRPEPASVQALLDASYDEKHLLGIVLAIGIKTLSNYTIRPRLRGIAPQLPVMFGGMADDATIRLTAGLAGVPVTRDSVLHETAARPMRVDRRYEPFQRT